MPPHPFPPPPKNPARSGHCKELAPKWRKLADALHGVVKVAAVNCEKEQGLCQQHGVNGYPSIKAFRCVGMHVRWEGGGDQ